MSCPHLPHLLSQAVRPPSKPFVVDECGQCFLGIEEGLHICTACFVASCREHGHLHYNKSSHQFTISLRLVDVERDDSESEDSEDSDEDYQLQELQCALHCWQCGPEEYGAIIGVPAEREASQTIDAIIDAIRIHFGRSTDTPPPSTELQAALPVFLTGLLETAKIRNRYLPTTGLLHTLTCPNPNPRTCFTCQMYKLAMVVHDSIKELPSRLSTKDVEELLPDSRIDDTSSMSFILTDILDLCKTTSRSQGGKEDIFDPMGIQSEIRTECNQCKGVSYKRDRMDTIRAIRGTERNMEGVDVAAATFWSINSWAATRDEKVDCPACHARRATVRRRFAAFPPVLVVEQSNGFVSAVDWNAVKGLDLAQLQSRGPQDGETLLPEPRPTTPQRPRAQVGFLSPPKSGKRGLFPPSPTKSLSPTKRKRAAEADRLRQTTPSPTRRRRQMEERVPTPVKRAKEVVAEDTAEQEASEQDIAAICALGFERDLAIQALGDTGGDVKKAVATLLAWENEEEEEPESDEEEDEAEEEEESDDESTSSSFEELRERFGDGADGDGKLGEAAGAIKSGKYVLRAIVGRNGEGLWAVLKRDGIWIGRDGLLSRDEESARLEGVRLEFWDRL